MDPSEQATFEADVIRWLMAQRRAQQLPIVSDVPGVPAYRGSPTGPPVQAMPYRPAPQFDPGTAQPVLGGYPEPPIPPSNPVPAEMDVYLRWLLARRQTVY